MKEKIALISSILTFIAAITTALIQKGDYLPALFFGISTILCFLFFILIRNIKSCKNFENHKIWTDLRYWKERKIKHLRLDDPLREKLLKTAITIKFEIIEIKLKEFIKNKNEMSRANVKNLIDDIILDYESHWREFKIPEIFITKFYDFHMPKVKELNTYLEFMIGSKLYTEDEKLLSMIDHFNVVLQWTIVDIETANNSINGELTKQLEQLRENGDF